jgi:glycerophosphoryl diester phosphodiesterase/membrane-associated phospholipid phosphatase
VAPLRSAAMSSSEAHTPGGRRVSRWLLVVALLLLAAIVAAWSQVEPKERVGHFAEREVSVIAHAGAQGHAPSNTIEAFEIALEQGADTLEMDLQLTADDEVVAIHDGTVDRTTDGEGAVRDLTLDELKELDAGWYFEDDEGEHPFRGQGVEIPTLAEILESFDDAYLVLELKLDGGEAIIQEVIDLVVEHDRQDTVTIASFSEDYLGPVREQLPDVPTNMPESESTAFYVRQLVGLHPWWDPPGELFQVPETHDASFGPVELDDLRVPTARFVRAAERLGLDVHVWTVNEPEAFHRLLDAGVHGIITDYPDRLVEVIEQREAERLAVRGPDELARYADQIERSERLQEEHGWATPLMEVLTFLGDEEFYLLAFPLLYWVVSRRLGLRLGVMLLLTASLNSWLKLLWATPRPSFLVPQVGAVTETSFGLPSGHAQNAAAIWGTLAVLLRGWWVRLALVVLIALIGWSRIHLGVHFLEDMLLGWLVGGLLVLGFVLLGPRIGRWWQRQHPAQQVLAAVTASLALIAPAALLSGRLEGLQFPWPGLADPAALTGASHAVTPAATLAGFGIGLVALSARGGFDSSGPWGQRALRALLGLVGVVVLWQGLGALLPGGEEPLDLVLRYLRYALVGAWVGGLAPALFVRLGLARPAGAPATRPADPTDPVGPVDTPTPRG